MNGMNGRKESVRMRGNYATMLVGVDIHLPAVLIIGVPG